ncbi:MAG: hypothetical protein RR396_04340 [Clostridiales bacterium]
MSIIGGADATTSIFVTGNHRTLLTTGIILILAIIGLAIWHKKRKNN